MPALFIKLDWANAMKKGTNLKYILALLLAPLFPAYAVNSDFNDGWQFHFGDTPGAEVGEFRASGWEPVALPHPARLEARICGKDNNQQWEGICWYRKDLTLPPEAAGKVVIVRFEGAMNRATLYANGRKIAENTDGYLPLVGDLTPFAKTAGKITLAVRLDNASNPITGPKPQEQLDFHLYHGLYRPASLAIKPRLHITDEILENKPASGGVFVTYPQVSEKLATVDARVHLRNSEATPSAFSLVARLSDPANREVARKESANLTLDQGEDRAFSLPLTVTQPHRRSAQALDDPRTENAAPHLRGKRVPERRHQPAQCSRDGLQRW